LLTVDEAGAQLSRSSSGDSGVINCVFAQIAQFMGNTDYRGVVPCSAPCRKKPGMAAFSPDLEKFFLDNATNFSGADIEAVLVRSRMRAALDKKVAVDGADLKAALEHSIPSLYPTEIDLQNIVAVLECTSKSLLPKQWRDADRKELIRRVNELLEFSRESGEG
jgi:hypothetical protein